MTDPEMLDSLRQALFLRNVSTELLERLAAISVILELPAGTVVFRQGDPARAIYLVSSGQVSIEICASGIGCKQILTVGPGELLGWSPVLEQPRFTATARTAVPTRLIKIDAAQAASVWDREPVLGHEFMKKAAIALARRLNATRLQLLNVYGAEMPESTFFAPETSSATTETPAS